MSTFTCTYEEFCGKLKEFREVLQDQKLTQPELEQAWKCITLFYFGINYASPAERILAVQRFQYISREYLDRDVAFDLQEN